jgi:hypothetical protein
MNLKQKRRTICHKLPSLDRKRTAENVRELTDALNKHNDEPAEPKDCQETAAERSSQAILTELRVTNQNWKKAVHAKSDTISY